MTKESAQYISDLNQAYPEDDVSASGGNDHIQMTKQVLKNTFSNATSENCPVDLGALATGGEVEGAKIKVGSGDPNGAVTADYKGQVYWDTSGNYWQLYKAEAADDSSWTSVVTFSTVRTTNLLVTSSAELPSGTTVGGETILTGTSSTGIASFDSAGVTNWTVPDGSTLIYIAAVGAGGGGAGSSTGPGGDGGASAVDASIGNFSAGGGKGGETNSDAAGPGGSGGTPSAPRDSAVLMEAQSGGDGQDGEGPFDGDNCTGGDGGYAALTFGVGGAGAECDDNDFSQGVGPGAGGGGNSSGGSNYEGGGGGGGGGAAIRGWISVSEGEELTVQVGEEGTGNDGADGNPGRVVIMY